MQAMCATAVACGPTLDEGSDAHIRVMPPKQVTFSRVTVGESRTMPFVVSSVGRDMLDVRRIEWSGSDAVQLVAEGVAFPAKLQTLASLPVSVSFTPTQQNPSPAGQIKIYTNDIEQPVYTLDVVAQQLAPQIHVTPSHEETLIIGQTDVGATTTRDVVITNVGDLALNLSDISLNGPESFRFVLPDDVTLPASLLPNAANQLTVRVSFTPSEDGSAEGTLVIVSNDPDNPRYTVPIIANSDTPCMRVEPSVLEFPSVSVGTSSTKTVKLTSCSAVPLVVSEVIRTTGRGSEFFTHVLNSANTALQAGEHADLDITFSPTEVGTSSAAYTILSNDPRQPNARLDVIATASSNRCPTASARARLSSSSAWSKTLDLAPLDTVILDGSLSSDPESSNLQYFWSIKKVDANIPPRDSTSQIVADGDKASFFLDLAGEYVICLDVADGENMMSCNTDCVQIRAIPRDTIHIQLVWNTPADTTSGDDDGTDLDLHLMSLPDGTWGDEGNAERNDGTDVFFLNRQPVWHVNGQNEYPSLDIDDKDGDGPENINLNQPAPCRWYAIGVHYYQDYAFGPSYATVRAYINGKLRFERANIGLKQTGAFRQVALMFWDGSDATLYQTDITYDNDDDWKGKKVTIPAEILDEAKLSSPSCFTED